MALLSILLVGWCALHSLLITRTVRNWVRRRGGIWFGLYRAAYVAFSLATFPPLLWYMAALPQRTVLEPSTLVLTVQGVLFLYACFMFVAGARVYDTASFLGLRQWRHCRDGKTPEEGRFTRSGILNTVRHPWYSGGIALLLSLQPVTDVTLVGRSILVAYFILGTLLEERKLRAEVGAPYETYQREVPMLVPWRILR